MSIWDAGTDDGGSAHDAIVLALIWNVFTLIKGTKANYWKEPYYIDYFIYKIITFHD